MLRIDYELTPGDLAGAIGKFWELSGSKILDIENSYPAEQGSPVFTEKGKYTTRGWTEWTQGFQHGSAILQFDATGDPGFLEAARELGLQANVIHSSDSSQTTGDKRTVVTYYSVGFS